MNIYDFKNLVTYFLQLNIYNAVLFHFLAKGKKQSSRRHYLLAGVSTCRAVFIIVNFFYFQPAHTHYITIAVWSTGGTVCDVVSF